MELKGTLAKLWIFSHYQEASEICHYICILKKKSMEKHWKLQQYSHIWYQRFHNTAMNRTVSKLDFL